MINEAKLPLIKSGGKTRRADSTEGRKTMCSWIVETAALTGKAKGPDGWFDVEQANVYFDHPFSAAMDHALIIDFVKDPRRAGDRVAVEISAESARQLIASIERALTTGEAVHILSEHSEETAGA